MGWVGSLSLLNPGEGYKYYLVNTTAQTFVYPPALASAQFRSSANENALNLRWTATANRFANNMTMTSMVLLDEQELQNENIEIGAFCGDECRGSVRLKNFPQLSAHPYLGFLVVYGENDEDIRLRIYNHETGQEYEADNLSLSFVSDAIHGSPANPYTVTASPPTGASKLPSDAIMVYLDPSGEKLNIRHPWSSIDQVEIIDLNGRILWQETGFASASVDVSLLAKGIYLLKLVKGNQVSVYKFVK